MPARRQYGGVGLATLLILLARFSGSYAQTALPPDPSKTIGGTVSFAGFVDEHERDAAMLSGGSDVANAGRAWIVSPIYTRCPFTCSPLTTSLRAALQASGLQPSEYRVVSFSFDPHETGETLRAFRSTMQLPEDWLTLRAATPGALEQTLESLDFRTIEIGDGQYAHPNLIALLAPDMRLTDYIFGISFSPTQLAAAVRAARRGGSWSRGWHGYVLVLSGAGLIASAFVFFTVLLRRRRA